MNEGRIKKELLDVSRDIEITGVTARPLVPDNVRELLGTIKGPQDSPYEGGFFDVNIVVPGDYPFSPLKMSFKTKVWHPNVSSVTGAICLDILKDQWSPALSIKSALLSLQALLSAPEPNDPQDGEVAKQYLASRDTFDSTAKFWTETYAMPANKGQADKEDRLVQMGFDLALARSALQQCNGDEEAALEKLLMG